jgi:DNA-binding NtrC family response regulator
LFLDEIGDLPLDAQVKLLRAIQEGEIDPVGGRKTVKVNIRVISATHRNLLDLVKEGRFREDLYYRLNVFPIFVPPLRDRKEDIASLTRHFMTRFAAEEGHKSLSAIHPQTLAMLQAHAWPGNVRQLENAVFRAVVLCESDALMPSDFPQVMGQAGQQDVSGPSPRMEAEPQADAGSGCAGPAAAARSGRKCPGAGADGRGNHPLCDLAL